MLRRLLFAAVMMLSAGPLAAQDDVLSLAGTADAGLYSATLELETYTIPLNTIQSWTLVLTNADGTPVEGATITVDGGMPAHGHGLPTAPEVTEDLGDGHYRIEGIRFSMAGAWVLILAISAQPGDDRVVFSFDL